MNIKTPTPSAPASNSEGIASVPLVALIATLGALSYGYDTGVISGALPFMKRSVDQGGLALTPLTEGLVTASLVVGAAFGSFLAGRIADRYGRKRTLILLGLVYMLGAFGSALSPNVPIMVALRFFLGLGVGGASAVVPMYLAEIAAPGTRGRLVTRNELMIVGGQLLAYICNAILAQTWHNPGVWRYMLAIPALPAVGLWVGMLFVSESPRWLAIHRKPQHARAVLEHLRHDKGQAKKELTEILAIAIAERGNVSWREIAKPWVRRIFLIGCGLGFMLQFTGINAFMYFTPSILQSTGMGTNAALTATITNGVISVAATFLGIFVMSRLGRRPTLMTGLTGIVCTMVILGLVMTLLPTTPIRGYVALGLILVFLTFNQGFISPVYWVLMSEMFPIRFRGIVMGLAVSVQWVFNAIVAFVFPIVNSALGGVTFYLFAALNVVSLIFVWCCLPETKGRSLEQIEETLRQRYSPEAQAPADAVRS